MPKNLYIFLFISIGFKIFASSPEISDTLITIDRILLYGNKVTTTNVILREIEFTEKETITKNELYSRIEKSKDNLLKTSLFNYVYIDFINSNRGYADIAITLEERWYIWPGLYFNHADRNLSAWWKSKDFSRINYGAGINWYNFRGRQEKLFFSVIAGYTNQILMGYQNLFLDRKRRHSFDFDIYLEKQGKIDYNIIQNEPIEFKADSKIFKKNSFYFQYTYRKKIHESFRVTLSYFDYNISDTIVFLNENFLGNAKKEVAFTGISFNYENDHRDLKYYPLKGLYLSGKFSYYGLFSDEISKPELRLSFHKFFQIKPALYASAGFNSDLSLKIKQPYILKALLGYDYFLRGYENYVISGNNYFLLKTNLKYRILPVKIINLKFLPFDQVNKVHFTAYFNLFFDAGYVKDYFPDAEDNLVNKGLYSYGAGIDLVTYYDKMLRLDVAHNGLGEWGFFISVDQSF